MRFISTLQPIVFLQTAVSLAAFFFLQNDRAVAQVATLSFCLNGFNQDCDATTTCPIQEGTYCEGQWAFCFIVYHNLPGVPNTVLTITVAQAGGPNYVWSGPPSSTNFTRFPMNTPPLGTTTYTLVSIESTTAPFTFDVSQSLPVVLTILPGVSNLAITQTGQACFANAAQLIASSDNAISYNWSNGEFGSNIFTAVPGVYTVTATASNGCTTTATTTVVNPIPQPLLIFPTGVYCQGQPLTINVQPASGATFLWSTGSTGATTTIIPPGTVSVVATAPNGCTATVSQTYTPGPAPMPTINGPGVICPGQMVTLATVGSFQTYNWSSGQTSSGITINVSGTYTVTVSNATGCTGTATINVAMAVPPTIAFTSPSAVCENGCQTITATLTGAGPFQFLYQVQQNGTVLSSQTVTANTSPYTFSVCPPGSAGSNVQIVACTVSDQVCP